MEEAKFSPNDIYMNLMMYLKRESDEMLKKYRDMELNKIKMTHTELKYEVGKIIGNINNICL